MRFSVRPGSRYEAVKSVLCVPIVASKEDMKLVESDLEDHHFEKAIAAVAAASDFKLAKRSIEAESDRIVVGVIEVTKTSVAAFSDHGSHRNVAAHVLKAAFKGGVAITSDGYSNIIAESFVLPKVRSLVQMMQRVTTKVSAEQNSLLNRRKLLRRCIPRVRCLNLSWLARAIL